MKTPALRLPTTLALLALALSACGKDGKTAAAVAATADSSVPASVTQSPVDSVAKKKALTPVGTGPFELTKSYNGDIMHMAYPNKDNVGWVELSGPEAAALYQALQLKETNLDGGTEKAGLNIHCRKYSADHLCDLYFNYRTGIAYTREFSPEDLSVPVLAVPYSGDHLLLEAPHSGRWGWLRIQGEDARALFYTLEGPVVTKGGNTVWMPSQRKERANVACYRQAPRSNPSDIHYACSMFLNYSTGTISPITD